MLCYGMAKERVIKLGGIVTLSEKFCEAKGLEHPTQGVVSSLNPDTKTADLVTIGNEDNLEDVPYQDINPVNSNNVLN